MATNAEGDSSETKSKASANGPAKVTSGSSASDGSGFTEGREAIKKGEKSKKRSAAAAALDHVSANEDLAVRSKLARLQMGDPDRVRAWQLLLPTRPQAENEEHMSAWLMRIMAVSDTARPISEVLSNLELVPPRGQDAKPTEVPMTHSETEEDTNDSNATSGSGVKPDSTSASSPQDGPPLSSSNDSSNMDSNESNESSSDNGLREDNENNNSYSSETQDPMGSSPTESTSSDDSNDSSSSENNQEGMKRKFDSMSSTSSDNQDQDEAETSTDNRTGHKYSSQESGLSSSGSNAVS